MDNVISNIRNFRLSRNQIKWIALILMICDHIGAIFVAPDTNLYFVLRYVLGRSSYPLFLVIFLDGFFYTKHPWRHVLDLSIFGIISEFTYDLAFSHHKLFDWSQQNVMFSWLLCFVLCMVLKLLYDNVFTMVSNGDSAVSIYMAMVGVILLFSVAAIELNVDYSYVGILSTGIMFFIKVLKKDVKLWQLGLVVVIIDGISLMTIWTFPAVLILMLYGVKTSSVYKHNLFLKYFFYAIYPLHLGVFALIYFVF